MASCAAIPLRAAHAGLLASAAAPVRRCPPRPRPRPWSSASATSAPPTIASSAGSTASRPSSGPGAELRVRYAYGAGLDSSLSTLEVRFNDVGLVSVPLERPEGDSARLDGVWRLAGGARLCGGASVRAGG